MMASRRHHSKRHQRRKAKKRQAVYRLRAEHGPTDLFHLDQVRDWRLEYQRRKALLRDLAEDRLRPVTAGMVRHSIFVAGRVFERPEDPEGAYLEQALWQAQVHLENARRLRGSFPRHLP